MRRFFDFFVFSSLFIATGAVLMGTQSLFLFDLPVNFTVLIFIFSGTVCSYNFHWFLTTPASLPSKKTIWNIANRKIHLFLSILGLAGAFYSGIHLLPYWPLLVIAAFLAFLYSAPMIPWHPFRLLRKVAIGKTIYLAFSWTWVTALLPLLAQEAPLPAGSVLYCFNRFLFIFAICILFDLRDREQDRKAGIRSLVTWFSPGQNLLLFRVVLFCFFISLFLLYPYHDLVEILLLGLPALLLAFLFNFFNNNRSDYNYYFLLDGLMILSAPMVVLAKFAR